MNWSCLSGRHSAERIAEGNFWQNYFYGCIGKVRCSDIVGSLVKHLLKNGRG